MCCSFCLNKVCGKTRDAETNTYYSDTEDLEMFITELQEKNETLEKYCTELEEEIEMLKTAHKDFIFIDQPPSFPEPSPPPLTPPPGQLRPPHTECLDSGDERSLQPPDTGSPGTSDEGSWSRRVRPAQRRARSAFRRSPAKNRVQPPVKKTAAETAGTSTELPSRAPAGKKPVVMDKPRLRRRGGGGSIEEEEEEVQERSPPPPCDVLGLSNEEDQYEADDVVDTRAELLPTHTSTANIEDTGEYTHEREDQEREERLNCAPEWEDPLNLTPERELEDRLNSPSEREERLNTPPPERKASKRRRPAVNYREEEDQEVDDPKSAPEREVGKRRHPIVSHKEQKDQDAGNSVGGGTVHCHHCEFTCLEQDRLDRHVKRRHGHLVRNFRYKCNRCEYCTDRKYAMTLHRRAHTGERPYRCDDCEKTFTNRSALIAHGRTHTGQRPYMCDVCGKKFTRTNNLTVHKRIHTGEKVAECEQCGTTFYTLSNYTTHLKYHNAVKAYRCQVCPARFVQRSDLTRHMRVHTGERPYGCSFCPARFRDQGDMNHHVTALHTHDFKHRCGRCGKGFLKPFELRKHETKCFPVT